MPPMLNPRHSVGKQTLVFAGISVLITAAAVMALHYESTPPVSGVGDPELAVAPQFGSITEASPAAFKISFSNQPQVLPDIRFADGGGHDLSLADFRGRPIVFNLWATWCTPCRQEMPTFERLQTLIGKSVLLVLPLSIDPQGTAVVAKFYQEVGLKDLGTYLDRSGKAASAVGVPGLPATLIIDREGREIGRKIGPADWFDPAIVAALRERLRLP
jgi:thiol-disulfide isomerase/thioredoxin